MQEMDANAARRAHANIFPTSGGNPIYPQKDGGAPKQAGRAAEAAKAEGVARNMPASTTVRIKSTQGGGTNVSADGTAPSRYSSHGNNK